MIGLRHHTFCAGITLTGIAAVPDGYRSGTRGGRLGYRCDTREPLTGIGAIPDHGYRCGTILKIFPSPGGGKGRSRARRDLGTASGTRLAWSAALRGGPTPQGRPNPSTFAMGARLWKNAAPLRVLACSGARSGKSGYAKRLTGPSWPRISYAVAQRTARALLTIKPVDGFSDGLGRIPPQNRDLRANNSPISAKRRDGFAPSDATTGALTAAPDIQEFQELDNAVRASARICGRTAPLRAGLTVLPRPGGRG